MRSIKPNAGPPLPVSEEKIQSSAREFILSASSARDACSEGLFGSFIPVENDFTTHQSGVKVKKYFRDNPKWDNIKKQQVKRFRFVIATLGLIGLALCIMSRIMLNVAIVDMVKQKIPLEVKLDEVSKLTESSEDLVTTGEPSIGDSSFSTSDLESHDIGYEHTTEAADEDRFEWSGAAQSTLLASFHMGYIPSMLFGGGIADSYGSKYPLFICSAASFILNAISPLCARHSIYLLIAVRILLGLSHGGMIPATYELFNKWLTLTETSIFVPLVKVSLSAGTFLGSLLPGLLASLGYDWPYVFYVGSFVSLIWCVIWLPLATSTPQTNSYVESNELHRIMRKKKPPVVAQLNGKVMSKSPNSPVANGKSSLMSASKKTTAQETPDAIPWLKIVFNPSVLALTFVKYTYNMGMELWGMEIAVYLREVHDAPTTTISAIAGGGPLLQMALITLVGWSAQVAVERRCFNLSRTSWRKIFQGLSNFSIAFIYIMLALMEPNLGVAAILIVLVHFFWMFGAGGESMVPYDLSSKYPATIMGLAHGISVTSGLTVPSVCGLVLGEFAYEPQRWNMLFYMLAGASSLGGLVFCLILKSEPFLPGEKKPPHESTSPQIINSIM